MCVWMARLGGSSTSDFFPHRGHARPWVFDGKGDKEVADETGLLPLVEQVLGFRITLAIAATIQ